MTKTLLLRDAHQQVSSMTLPPHSARFHSTRWSLIQAANRQSDHEIAHRALNELCSIYWFPLYAFARKQGAQVADAQEQVQSFFLQLLSGSFLEKANAEKGKFRSFLLKSFQNFCSDLHRQATTEKRGGQAAHFSIDAEHGETRYQLAQLESQTAEELYERQWALSLLEASVESLRSEYESKGRQKLFERLIPHINQQSDARPYQEIAESLATTETAIKVAAYRLRKRYRELLRAEIAGTIQKSDKVDVDEELQWLITRLG